MFIFCRREFTLLQISSALDYDGLAWVRSFHAFRHASQFQAVLAGFRIEKCLIAPLRREKLTAPQKHNVRTVLSIYSTFSFHPYTESHPMISSQPL